LTSLASLVLGLFVFLKGKDKLANVTLGGVAATIGLWCFGQFMGEMVVGRGAVLFWTRVGVAGAIFIPVLFMHFIFALLGRADKERSKIYAVYGAGMFFLIMDLTPFFVRDVGPAPGFRYYPQPGFVYPFFAAFVAACFVYGFWRLFRAYRGSAGERRNQLLYMVLASLIGFLGGLTSFLPIWGISFPVLSHFALPLYVLITVYAILKHHLLDISVIVREGLIYSALTVLFAGFYVLAVLTMNYLFSHLVGFNPALAVLLVIFISVLVFQPLRDRVQKLVDRIFFQGEFQYIKTIHDLSEENRRLFRSLLQADKLAALGTLSAGMAHEIKNPLSSIKGMTQVLEENLNDPDFILKFQDIVPRQIDRINGLIEKLLKSGQPQGLSLAEVDLNRVIEDVLGLIEAQCRKQGVTLVKQLSAVPRIMGDAEQLSQALMNLALNALQAMPAGGTLTIGSWRQGAELVGVEVGDTGTGIPEEKLDRIFDPFFTSRDEGTGMGLAVVYRVIKEHGGEIQVESRVGKGTRFSLWLSIRPKRSV